MILHMRVKLTIREIETLLSRSDVSDKLIQQLYSDERKGVQKILNKWVKQQELMKQVEQLYAEMSQIETKLHQRGFKRIAGVDEVGRGSIAGPVVAAAVILPEKPIYGIKDSKQLPIKKRNELYRQITEQAVVGIGVATAKEIDETNIYQATKSAMAKAVWKLRGRVDHLLIDAMTIPSELPQTALIKGDQKSVSIAAASIVAKVTRDAMMAELAKTYPQYGFEKNVGYGTKEHVQALQRYGTTRVHRHSFAPVAGAVRKG